MSEQDDIAAHAAALSSALAKLPPAAGVVYRGATLSPDVVALYVPGQVLREDAFTSASRHGGVHGTAVYEIDSTGGRDLAPFSDTPAEAEVVFPRGTAFLVLAVEQVAGRTHILLADVAGTDLPDAGAAIARIHERRSESLAPGGPAGLRPDKEFFPVGIRPDGTANRIG